MSISAPASGLDFGILLNLAFGAFKDELHRYLATQGFDDIGGSFGFVIRTLNSHADGLSLKDLAAALAVTPQGTLKIVDDMVAKGYVSRSTDPVDTRVKRLRVAARGAALLAHARDFHQQFEAQLAHRHGAANALIVRQVLEALVQTESLGPSMRMQLL